MKRFLLAATALTTMTAVASAADLPRRYAAPAPAPMAYAAPAFTWTGFYVGANAGGAVSSDINVRTSTRFGSASETVSAGGFNVGGTVGYNFQISPNFVLGVEGDIGYADIQARATSSSPGFSATSKSGIDGYLGTIRGRIGYATGQWLFYGTGGYAFADGRSTSSFTSSFPIPVTTTTSSSQDLQGYVVGGGVEYAVNQALSVKAEYLYIDFDKKRIVTPVATSTTSQDVHLLKVGVNYRFSAF